MQTPAEAQLHMCGKVLIIRVHVHTPNPTLNPILMHVQAPPWVRAQMAKEMAAGRWRGQAKPSESPDNNDKREVPKPYMSAQYREDAMHTTGMGPL